MLKLFIVTFLSFVLFQLAQAASVNIISPQPNDVLKAGETVEIKWKLAKDATVDKVMIALASGPAQALLIDEVIEQGVEAKNGTYKWKIPENIKPNPKYVLEIGPHSADIAFAGYFSIVKATNPSTPSKSASASASAGHKKPAPSASASKSVVHNEKVKPTATLPSSVIKAKPTPTPSASESAKGPVRVMCVAYPDEDDKMTTTCRPVPVSTVKPKVHGSHKRKEKSSTTTELPKATPKPVEKSHENEQ